MKDSPEITALKLEAEHRRTQLFGTAERLQERLSPKRLSKDAWEGAKEKGAGLAEDAVDAVKARPLAAGGVVAALALFLAREPLMDLAGRLVDGFSVKRETKKRRKASSKTKTHTEAAE